MDLAARRYQALIHQLRDELGGGRGWKTEVARRLGTTQPWITYIDAGERAPGRETISDACARLGLKPDFFFDASLGDEPSYRDHLATRTDRDDARSPYLAVEEYLSDEAAAERPPVSPEHARELRAIRYSGEVTVGMVSALHRELIARDRGKAIAPKGAVVSPAALPEGVRRISPSSKKSRR